MNSTGHHKPCRQLRASPDGFWTRIKRHLAERCSSHIASCPRCQKRLAAVGRVEVGLCLMRMQPHTPDLLARANTSALKYLTRSLRQRPQAEQLRHAVFGPGRLEKATPLLERLIHIAACLFILLMVRAGIINKMFQIKEQGTAVMQNYYARHLDAETLDEIFESKHLM